MTNDLAPIPQKMLSILSDGESHTVEELRQTLADELGKDSNIQPHLSELRRYLKPHGGSVQCELPSKDKPLVTYRLVQYTRGHSFLSPLKPTK